MDSKRVQTNQWSSCSDWYSVKKTTSTIQKISYYEHRMVDGKKPNVTFVRNIKPNGFVLEDFVGKRIRGQNKESKALLSTRTKTQSQSKDVSVLVLETPKDRKTGEQGGPWTLW